MSTTLSPPRSATASTAEQRGAIITFEEVTIEFEEKMVLEDVSFDLKQGETKVLLGIAGAGKTTILKLVLGLIKPDRGRITVLGQDVSAMPEVELFDLRRRIGMVFQESALFDSLTVEENVAYRLIEEGNLSEEEIHRRVVEVLRFVELEHTLGKVPSELSGGMRRRVAIARAMVSEPEILLYDSPTGGLDPITSTTIIELIVKQRDVYKTSSLMVSHRLQDGFMMASHYFDTEANEMRPLALASRADVHTTFLVLRDGHVLFDGTLAELAASRDEYIREYIS
jgi:phospholipid/cholesterol/gamma-HCH transport system ATP-binding protein